ncbi:MAG: protein kinase [Polyangiaceae bacterium]|nr:protein kinase [Polyangiaceae bacterium]
MVDPPRTLGRFEIVGTGSAGGNGTVYPGRDTHTGARVAIKVLLKLGDADRTRFQREAATLARIQHPAIVRYIDHGITPNGSAYVVMEWLEGPDLRKRLMRGTLSVLETAQLGQRVAEALAALHAHRLIHRDVKPGNIVLRDGKITQATLVDFGLARADHAISEESEVTAAGVVVGTPAYMAPEQARGLRSIDGRADLFSLGCVLYRALMGRAPFDGKQLVAVLTKVILEPPPPLQRADVPKALSTLISRLLEKEPDRRLASAVTVARTLAQIGEDAERGGAPDDENEEPPSSRPSITTDELRIASVLLVRAPDADRLRRNLRILVDPSIARVDKLLDGTLVVTVVGDAPVSDQAAHVAEIALSAREVARASCLAIATGRAELSRADLIGDAIDRAAFLLESCSRVFSGEAKVAPPILMDQITSALIAPRFVVREAGTLRLLVAGRALEKPERTVLGRVTPIVGRGFELRSIETLFSSAVEESTARAALITGPAGIGKSRLAQEVVRMLRTAHPSLEVWWGHGDPMRNASPLSLLGEMFRTFVGLSETESLEERRQKLLRALAAHAPSQEYTWVAHILGEIGGTPFPEHASVPLEESRIDARRLHEMAGRAVNAFIRLTTARTPLLVILNDLQWADAASVHIVGEALSSLNDRPWLVLALGRPEVHNTHPNLWAFASLQEIPLRPLSKRASSQLVREILGDVVGADTVDRIVSIADGNAFFLEELIRAEFERKTNFAAALPLPETVLGMVQSRLFALDAEARRVLRAASVFGDTFWAEGVAALLGGEVPETALGALVAGELITQTRESRLAGRSEYQFRHDLIREGAYSMLTRADRACGHSLAAEWLRQQPNADPAMVRRHEDLITDDRPL